MDLLGDPDLRFNGDLEWDFEPLPLTGDLDLECDCDLERWFDFAPDWEGLPPLLLWDSAAEEEELRDLDWEWDFEATFFLRLLSLSGDFLGAL